jgi:DsbC/DsbD-like thiol-disulfide interchange protein
MRPIHSNTLLFAILALTVPVLAADTDEIPPVEISLVSESTAIEPGQKFSVGIHQKISPGYHTYWKNPGTVGLPLSMHWDLPAGFRTNEIQWPTPEVSRMAAYDVWGYHNDALLLVTLQAPDDLRPGTTVELTGKAAWMCCGRSCYPGHKTLTLRLPVAKRGSVDPELKRRFDLTRADQPQKTPHWKTDCTVADSVYHLSVSSDTANRHIPRKLRFYDYDRQISSEKGQTVRTLVNGAIIRMHHEENTGEELPRLRGILVADTEWEPGVKVLAVDIPILGRRQN